MCTSTVHDTLVLVRAMHFSVTDFFFQQPNTENDGVRIEYLHIPMATNLATYLVAPVEDPPIRTYTHAAFTQYAYLLRQSYLFSNLWRGL